MIGRGIAAALAGRGAATLRLVRRAPNTSAELRWNPAPNGEIPDAGRLEGISAAIHLSGAPIAGRRWTVAYKQEMAESRVASTRVLSEALARLESPPSVLVVASAIGFYGNRGEELLDESSAPGTGFFPELCQAWEAATRPAAEVGIRVVPLRLGMVIGPGGGAMAKLAPMFRLGLGGPLGDGRQWMSWISEADAVAAALFALDCSALSGAINAVAPEPTTNAEFTQALGRAVHRPAVVPAPAFALRLAFGQMAEEALLASTRVIPQRLLAAGFRFQHPTLQAAFAAALEPAAPRVR
jgi:hypothetical protein